MILQLPVFVLHLTVNRERLNFGSQKFLWALEGTTWRIKKHFEAAAAAARRGSLTSSCSLPSSTSRSAPASFLPLWALQQRILGLQLRQLPAQAVHFVLELFVVFDDVDHFVVGLVQTPGGAAPAQKHSCDKQRRQNEKRSVLLFLLLSNSHERCDVIT